MGKRSNYIRRERDFYPTPIDAVTPLIPHLPTTFTFAEPCAGDARLALHIDELTDSNAIPTMLSDIEPQDAGVQKLDAFDFVAPYNTDYIITNPPWDRSILHPLIEHFSNQRPTWLLFDANWMFTKQARDYLPYCEKIVTIGRVKWIEGSKGAGKDDSCWYLFDAKHSGPTTFFGKT
jgi:hypothetical protein